MSQSLPKILKWYPKRATLVVCLAALAIPDLGINLKANAQTQATLKSNGLSPTNPARIAQNPGSSANSEKPCAGLPLEQINALRTEPEKAGELLEKFVAAAFPDEKARQEMFNERYGDKTLREHLDIAIKFIEAQPKMEPLQWDTDLVTTAANQGKSNNKLFTPEANFDTFDSNPQKALLWSLLRGVEFHYQPIFNPSLRYAGFAPKGNNCQMTFGSLKGKAYLMREAEFASRPYDPREDSTAPWQDALNVKPPNITSFVRKDGSLDVVWRDMGNPPTVFLTRYSASGAKVFTKAVPGVNPAQYQLLAGFTEDPEGNLYVLRAIDEGSYDAKNQPDPPKNGKGESDPTWDRPELMKLTKLDPNGNELWTKNLGKQGGNAFGFVSPLSPNSRSEQAGRVPGRDSHASTSRIGYIVHKGTPIIFALYGAATEWDASISGRHQNAYWRAVDAKTGEPVKDWNGSAMAHSFDNQLLVSDEGVITVERSDSGLLMANYLNTRSYPLIFQFFYGATTDGNESFTQLGSLAPASDGYLVLFVGNNTEALHGKSVSGAASTAEKIRHRNLLVMRIKKGFAQEIDALADNPAEKKNLDDALNSMVKSDVRDSMNLIGRTYLTAYNKDDSFSASRPKMVRLADGNYIIIWERWTHRVNKEGTDVEGAFDSTWAMKINQEGDVLKEAVKLSDTVRITRGDEPVLWNGKATFLAGDVVENKLMLYTVDSNLGFNAVAMPLN